MEPVELANDEQSSTAPDVITQQNMHVVDNLYLDPKAVEGTIEVVDVAGCED